MYKIPILVIKGFIIGLAKIIPGISGSLVALNLGLYERGIEAISNFFKNPKYNIMFLGTVGIGIVLSIVFGSKIIDYALFKYYIITMLFFIGLLVGTIPNLIKKANLKNKTQKLYFIITFTFMTGMFFIKKSNIYIYQDTLINDLYVILIGFIDALTMIIPGISGTATFMLMGCYDFFLSIFSNLTSITNIYENFKLIVLFIIGLFLGIVIVTKLMGYLLKNKKNIIYPLISAFSISSIIILFLEVLKSPLNIVNCVIGIILFIIGIKISLRFNYE